MQGRDTLARVGNALEMGPIERALYLKKSKSTAVQSEEEVVSTLAGSNPAGLRSWLRQVCASNAVTEDTMHSAMLSSDFCQDSNHFTRSSIPEEQVMRCESCYTAVD